MSSQRTSGGGGIDLPTLAITAAASAVAAYTCSKLWAPGTLASAAFTPVVIALLKEAFAKPTYAVARVVPVRGTVRSAPPPGEGSGAPQPPPEPIAERVPQQGEVGGPSRRRRRHWRMAIVTGLLGFVVAAIVITVPEYLAGSSAAGGDRHTTLFGGSAKSAPAEREQPDGGSGEDGAPIEVEPEQTVTVPPAQTVTVAPEQTETVPVQPTQTVPSPTGEPAP